VPRLRLRTGERDVEAELHDRPLRTEHRLAHADDPRVGDEVDKSAHLLRMDLDVEPMWASGQRSVRACDRLGEGCVDVLAHLAHPLLRKRTLQACHTEVEQCGHGRSHISRRS
jgi:hypothetical protein